MRITTIQRKRDLHKKRVAAYARVSTTLSEQSESYEEQREYYERIIKANPEYEFAGVYSDEMSGLDAKHRTGFQQMVDDALAVGRGTSLMLRHTANCSKATVLQ